MNKLPYFSIIVPCYNQAQYLKEAVLSVLGQTYTNWECIIINDGSPDNTEEIALSLCEIDNRIKYFYKQNGGVAETRNFGIDKALGEWILPVDGDDKISEKYLQRAYRLIQKNPTVSLIYSNAEFIGDRQGFWELPSFTYEKLLTSNMIFNSAIFKREKFLSVGGYDLNMVYGYEDWELWINLLKDVEEQNVYKLDSVDYYYRYKEHSRDRDMLKNKERTLSMKKYIFEKHKDSYYKYFGSIQDSLSEYLFYKEKMSDLTFYYTHIKYNKLTKGLYRLILILNKF